MDGGEDGGGEGGEADVDTVARAEDEAVGGEHPGPEEERAFLAGPEGGELVCGIEGDVRVGADVFDGEVVGEGGPDEGEGGAAEDEEAGHAGAAGGLAQAVPAGLMSG